MPKKTTTNTNKTKKNKKELEVESIDLEENEEAVIEELDPEVAAVLTASKKKNKKILDSVDYIPEFERGDLDIDASLPGEDY